MSNNKNNNIIKSINIILSLTGKETLPLKLEHNSTIKELEKKYAFKLKTTEIRLLLKEKTNQPIIFLDKNNNSFVLLKNNENKHLIYNIATKKTEVLNHENLIKNYISKCYFLKFKENNHFDISWFYSVFLKYKSTFKNILFYSLILQLLALASPLVMQVIMDKAVIHQALSTLDVLIIGLVFVAISEGVLKGLREYIYHHTANKIDMMLSLKLTQHLFKLPIGYFKARQTGTVVTRIKELDIVREFITNTLLILVVDFSFIFVFIFAMFILSFKLTLIFLSTIPCYFILAKLLAPRIEQAVQKLYQKSAINTAFLTESLSGIETIKSLSLEPRFTQQWNNQTHQLTNENLRLKKIDNISHYFITFIHKITTALILWIGAYEVISLSMTIGQLIAFNMLLGHCLQPLGKAIDIWGKYIRVKTAIYNLQDILNIPKEQAQTTATIQLKGEIIFNSVTFYYKNNTPPILNKVSLHIKKNEIVAIIGTSGSGKSTLAKMIPNLYTPQSGSITIDHIPISQLDPTVLRQQIGYVLQENYLFHLSVFNNIRLSVPNASLENVIHITKLVGAHEFILKLPFGYDTIIAEGGASLSGGQRQLIAIARAILSNPKILILDEATSALDDESQEIIQQNMPLIAKDKTVLIIAHRLSTIKTCHRIIVLKKGKIIEEGKHDELIKKQGHYQKIWQLQQEG